LEALDREVRRAVYEAALTRGAVPAVADVAAAVRRPGAEIEESLRRLAEAHILVLQQSGEILMAAPFSAVPTPFAVETKSFRAYGNCIWDALGIAAMARSDAVVHTACGCCGEVMRLHVASDVLRETEGVAHYAVPALEWWSDIVFT
jgi:hypothetical protein